MPTKKKGPAFDMDSAFSGLFSVSSPEEEKAETPQVVEPEVVKPEPVIPAVSLPQPEPVILPEPVADIPEGYEQVVVHRKAADQLTRQYTITLKRGTHEALRDIAWYTRQSVSSILNNLADQYIREHQIELDECRKIPRR